LVIFALDNLSAEGEAKADPPSLTCVTITPELGIVESDSSRIRPSGFSSWSVSVLVVVAGVDDMKSEVEDGIVAVLIMEKEACADCLTHEEEEEANGTNA